jgi:hypothetical protein
VELLPLLMLPFLLIAGVGWLLVKIVEGIVYLFQRLRERRRTRVERELDRTQAELRATILRLASELGADAHEARKALIRESYLAAGRAPDER